MSDPAPDPEPVATPPETAAGLPGPSEAAGSDGAAPGADADYADIGWPRAIASGLAILFVGFAGAVIGANRILTKALGLRRTPREWLATALFFVVIIGLAWVLRRLQDRKLI